eukprot:12424246-Karenia_brevis.AAC.1
MIRGDGQVVGSLVQKYYCESCKAMPMTDGQWFLYRNATGGQVWICAVCGSIFNAGNSPFCAGMKTGTSAQDILIVKAVAPGHKELATTQ